MNNSVNGEARDEASLITLYMELTGASESRARSVFMFVCSEHSAVSEGATVELRFVPDHQQATVSLEPASDRPRYTLFPERAIPVLTSA